MKCFKSFMKGYIFTFSTVSTLFIVATIVKEVPFHSSMIVTCIGSGIAGGIGFMISEGKWE